MACEDDYIDCSDKKKFLTPGQLFKLLLAKVQIGAPAVEKPALRVCVSNASEIGGLRVQHFVAIANQTVFTLANPILKDYALSKDGAIKQSGHNKTGPSEITMPPQLAGTEITIMY